MSEEVTHMEEPLQIVEPAEETDSDTDSDTEDLKKLEQSETKNLLIDFHLSCLRLLYLSHYQFHLLSRVRFL